MQCQLPSNCFKFISFSCVNGKQNSWAKVWSAPHQSYLAEIVSVKLVFYYLQHNKSLGSDHNLPGAELDLSETN